MNFINGKRYASYLTNGKDHIKIETSRFNCGITPPPGMAVSVLNDDYYINGRIAWIEIKEDGEL